MGVWKWTQRLDGSWQKPPFQARDPERHASTSDPVTWADYPAALAAVQAGHADGISYVLTADDPFSALILIPPLHHHKLYRRMGAELSRLRAQHLCGSDAVRHWRPRLGIG